jgi:hypothetical protein
VKVFNNNNAFAEIHGYYWHWALNLFILLKRGNENI